MYTKTFKDNTNNETFTLSKTNSLPDKDYDVSIEIDHSSYDIVVIKPKVLKTF